MSHNEPDDDGCRGAIVNTASVAAEDGQIGQAAYSSSKGGIVGLTLPLARDLAPDRRARELHPARPHRHPDLRHAARRPRSSRRASERACSSRSASATPSEFASLAVELLSNSYMNAESVRIDAGIRMQPK